mgnify:CR=1 FL=1
MMSNVLTQNQLDFVLRAAKAWQNYFEVKGRLYGVEQPTAEQVAIIQQEEKHFLILGSAGSGKSITLLYKLLKKLEQEAQRQRILYLSFNKTLVDDAKKRLNLSPGFDSLKEKHDLHFETFYSMAAQLLKAIGFHQAKTLYTSLAELKKQEDKWLRRVQVLLDNYKETEEYQNLGEEKLYQTHDARFVLDEILWLKANGYVQLEDYLDCERKGRSHNPMLTRKQRRTIFKLFEAYERLKREIYHDDIDGEDYALWLLKSMEEIPETLKFDHIFVDEVQDLQPMQLKAIAQLAKKTLTLSGDPKQTIYRRGPHSYSDLGIQIKGRRIRKLRFNFRSTRQIMTLARSLKFVDVDNDREDDLIFVREGPKPEIHYFSTLEEQNRFMIQEFAKIIKDRPDASIAVIHRFEEINKNPMQTEVAKTLGRHYFLLPIEAYGSRFDYTQERKPIFFTDPYSVKGLEFDYVFILHFDRAHYPLKSLWDELDKKADRASEAYIKDLDMLLNNEKKILYVAITRAKQQVYLLCQGKKDTFLSPFIRDFDPEDYQAFGFDKHKFVN